MRAVTATSLSSCNIRASRSEIAPTPKLWLGHDPHDLASDPEGDGFSLPAEIAGETAGRLVAGDEAEAVCADRRGNGDLARACSSSG
jgi:hypothetical protein